MSKVFDIAFKLGAELTSSFTSTFNSASGMMKMLGGAAAALGGAAALGSAVSQVADISQELSTLSAQTGLIGDDFKELKGAAENLFRNNYGDSFDEVTDALANVKQNMHELSDADFEQFTGQALSFTKTFDEDMNDVTRAANNMMSSFGVSSTTAMDLFAAGAQRGLNFSDEMLDNVAEYAPLFGEMGYSAEEYFGILERGAQAGVYNLDYVNDVMKEFQIRSKDGSKATSDAMGDLSKETQQVWKDYLKGKGTVADVASTVVGELQSMDDQVMANQIGVGLFGTKWEDLESTAMYAMLGSTEAMQGFEGTMETVNKIQFSSFNAAIRGIGRILFMDLVYPIGDAVLPYLNTFANYLSNNLPGAIGKAKSVIMSVGPAVLGIVGAFGAYKGAMVAIKAYQTSFNAIQKASIALYRAHRAAMVAFALYGGGVKGVLKAMAAGMRTLNLAMLANPVVLVVAGLVALGAGLYLAYKKSETFRNAIGPLLAVLKNIFVSGVSQIGSTVSEILPKVIESFKSLATPIKDLVAMVLPLLVSAAEKVFPTLVMIVETAAPIIKSLISSIAEIFTNGIIPAIKALLSIVEAVFPIVQFVIENALTLITGIIQAAMALLQGDWSGAWEIIKSTAETIMNNIVSFFSNINLYDIGVAVVNGLIEGIKSMGGAVLGAIGNLVPEPIKGAASKLLKNLPGFAEGGIVGNPTLAWIGEGGDTESVIPWNNSARSKDLWLQTGQALGMLNKDGLVNDLQQQVTLQSSAPDAAVIQPEQALSNNNGGGDVIIQYSPQYKVERPEDLEKVKQHADRDKDDLETRLEKIQRNERRLSFG